MDIIHLQMSSSEDYNGPCPLLIVDELYIQKRGEDYDEVRSQVKQ